MQIHKCPDDKIRAVLGDNFFYKEGPYGGDPPTTYFQSLTRRERAALELAECMTDICKCVSDEFFERIRKEFNKYPYAALVAYIAFMNFRTKFNQAMGIDSMNTCKLPEVVEECKRAKSCW